MQNIRLITSKYTIRRIYYADSNIFVTADMHPESYAYHVIRLSAILYPLYPTLTTRNAISLPNAAYRLLRFSTPATRNTCAYTYDDRLVLRCIIRLSEYAANMPRTSAYARRIRGENESNTTPSLEPYLETRFFRYIFIKNNKKIEKFRISY